jgi:hypothetical protein
MDTCDKCGKRAELFHNEASGLAYCETCETASHEVEGYAYGESTELAQIERWDGLLGGWVYVAEVDDGVDPLALASELRRGYEAEAETWEAPKYRLVRIIRQELV